MTDYTRGDDPIYNGFREGWRCPCDAKEEDIELNGIVEGIDLDRLEQLCQAEQDGRLIVLPCKVGDTVYRVIRHCTEAEFDDCVGCQRNINGRCQPKSFEQKFSVGLYDELSITAFLTKKEAEVALKESNDGN